MIIGILSDIHGNDTALEAVLQDAKKLNVEHLWILGDLVGYYYYVSEVFDLIDEWNSDIIRGNHEGILFDIIAKKISPESIHKKYGSGLSIAQETLSPVRLAILERSAYQKKLEAGKMSALICHGSPRDFNEYVYPDAAPEVLQQCDRPDVDFVLMGHTHYPFAWRGTHSLVANPGSVGQSRVRGGLADWATLNTSNGVYVQRHTPYDPSRMLEAVKKQDPHLPYLHDVLLRK